MSNKTRKYLWPGVLAMSMGIVGVLAAFLVLTASPGVTGAHGGDQDPHCTADSLDQIVHDADAESAGENNSDGTPHTCANPTGADVTDPNGGDHVDTPMVSSDDTIKSDSTSGSDSPQIELVIAALDNDLAVGSSIVVYLEDDFQEPDSIPTSSVYLVAEGGTKEQMDKTGNGSRVYVTSAVKIKTGDYFDEDKKDIAIRVLVPDMCTTDTPDCQTSDGPKQGQKLTLIIESDSVIKNPSEGGIHSVSFEFLGTADRIPSAATERGRNDARRAADKADGIDPGEGMERVLKTVRKIGLNDVDNKRGFELTVTGSGYKDGTSAAAYVLHVPNTEPGNAHRNAYLWNALSCEEMVAAVGDARPADEDNPYCGFIGRAPALDATEQAVVLALDFSKN